MPLIVYNLTCVYEYISGRRKELSEEQKKKNRVSEFNAALSVQLLLVSQTIANYVTYNWFLVEHNLMRFYMLILGIFIIDTFEYFFHRLYHSVPFLYKYHHKTHHEMIYPNSWGALYNSSFEATTTSVPIFLTFVLCNFSFEEYLLVTCISYVATVRDHTYTGKNGYHFIHHAVNPNTNFQQPFFVYWDKIMGTMYNSDT